MSAASAKGRYPSRPEVGMRSYRAFSVVRRGHVCCAGGVWALLGLAGACGKASRSEPAKPANTSGKAGTAGGKGGGGAAQSGGAGGEKAGQAGKGNAGAGGASAGTASTGGAAGKGGAGGTDAGAPGIAGRAAAGEAGEPSGSGGGAGAPSLGPLDPLVQAFCATARTCCEAAGMPVGSLEACESAFLGQTDIDSMIERGTVTLDETALSACVSAYAAAGDSCEWTAVHAACHGILKGTLSDDQPCSDAAECDRSTGPKLCLKLQNAANPDLGTCVTPERATEGEACLGTCALDTNCSASVSNPDESVPTALCHEADELFCRFGYGCAPLVDDGETCEAAESCGSDGVCLSTCEPRAESGESCVAIFDCAKTLTCESGYCAPQPVADSYTCSGHPPFID
jgi:hypothetical protein